MSNRTLLTAENLGELKKHFGNFHDGVIHQVQIKPFTQRNLKMIVGAQDFFENAEGNWVNVVFELEGVKQLAIQMKRNYTIGIIRRLNIGFFDGETYLDFFPYLASPQSPADYTQFTENVPTVLSMIGQRCFWYTEDYQESASFSSE